MKVELVCTTDDPADSLEHHIKIRKEGFDIRVLPTFRPDKSMAVENPASWLTYLERLEEASGMAISSYDDLLSALKSRHDFFHRQGCRLSDHGVETFYAEEYTLAGIREIFRKARSGKELL
jgi:glucuronate isomerase